MGKSVYIAEKPSVAAEFAKALKLNTRKKDGYMEGDDAIITWCVGHLVTMSRWHLRGRLRHTDRSRYIYLYQF